MSNPYYTAGRSYDSPSALYETPLTAAASALLSSAAAGAGGSAASSGVRSGTGLLSPSASAAGLSAANSLAPPSASVGIYERVEVLERSLSADSEWTKSLTARLAEELGKQVILIHIASSSLYLAFAKHPRWMPAERSQCSPSLL